MIVDRRPPDVPIGHLGHEADKPIGISVYGYGQYTSYWYPGGLDLEEMPQ